MRLLASLSDGILKPGSLSLEKRLGIDEAWEKLWGSTKVGAFAGLTLRNIVEFKLGLFGGFFQIDCFNQARVSAFVFGSQLDLLHAKVVFNAGAEFKTPIPPDLLAGIQKVGDNIMSTARSIAERIIGYLRVARNWVLDLHGRVSDYVSPVTGLLADAEVMLTGIIDTLDVSAVAKRFLDAATAAVNNLPIITFFRDSILTAVDQVGAMVADGAM